MSGWQDFLSRPAKHSRLFEVPRQPEGFALPAILSRRAAFAQGVMDSERHRRVLSWNDKAPESKQQTVLPPTPPQVRPLLRRSWCRLDAQRGSWGNPGLAAGLPARPNPGILRPTITGDRFTLGRIRMSNTNPGIPDPREEPQGTPYGA